MSDVTPKAMAKLVAKHLRHDPEGLGLSLDAHGWVSLEDLHFGILESTPEDLTLEDLEEILTTQNRKRFEFEADRVRASSGHTTTQVSYDVAEPPEGFMYLTFSRSSYTTLKSQGITPARKKFTEVFTDPLSAYSDAKRRRIKGGVLVTIDSHRAYHDGTLFYVNAGSWYVTEVDASHLEVTDLEEPED